MVGKQKPVRGCSGARGLVWTACPCPARPHAEAAAASAMALGGGASGAGEGEARSGGQSPTTGSAPSGEERGQRSRSQ